MGDAALPQPTAGGFMPMVGVGMVGSAPGPVPGTMSSTRGSAVPQLHNAIVERLRARIELCRRHHSNCESRYQRGQAESSDREHEGTLHLLNIVNQGPGHRKSKGSKATSHQPSEYNSNRVNGEQKSLNTAGNEPKNSTRIALQGSLRRKIEGQPPGFNPKQNGLSAGAFGPDLKRIRVDGGTMGHSGCAFSNGAQSHSLPEGAQMSHSLQRKDGNLMGPPPMGGDLFSLTLKEMKKEPGEVHSCGQSQASSAMDPAMMVFEFKEEEGDGQIDPELQDLFDELTKTVPSLNDLEFEKILKQDEEAAFGLDLGRPSSVGPAQPFAQLERAIKSEFSPSGFGHTPASSPQLRPASAGPALSMPPTSSSSPSATAIQNPGQGSLGSSLSSGGVPPGGRTNALTSWAEVSHAEQLKQIAANQQQQQPPAANLLQHHQHQHQQNQNQPATQAGWSPAHSSPGTISSPAGLCQSSILPPMSSAQGKGLNSCLFKTNGGGVGGVTISGVSISGVSSASCSSGSSMDMKALGSKPLSHFSHKPQQVGLMGAPQSKPAALRFQQPLKQPQGATPLPNQRQPPQHFHSPTLPPCQQPKSLPLNQKMPLNQHGPGLHFKLQQRQQALPPGARLPTSGSFGSVSAQPLPQHPSPAPGGQPKAPGQNQAMQRQLALQPHISNDSDKVNPQDQLSRHLTRPPPDYKQPRRNLTEPQQNNPYKGGGLPLGMNSAQALTGALSGQSGLQPSACHLPSGQGARMTPPPADRRFGGRPDPTQGGYSVQAISTQLQPHGNQNPPMGPNQNQNGPRFPGGSNLGNAFRSNGQQMRPPGVQEAPGLPRQRLVSMLTGTSVGSPPPNWAQGPKQQQQQQQQQVRLGLRRFPGPLPPHPGAQANMGSTGGHHFPQRPLVPSNQMAPDTPMLPLNQAMNGQGAGPGPNRGPAPRPPQPRMPPPLPTVSSLNQSPTSQAGSLGPFGAPSAQNTRPGYQGNQASGDLTFDFLQDGDNTVPGINSDSDFIDSLLKSGPGNDDWMKDINLDEILGSHS